MSSRLILLVEDDEAVRASAVTLLQALGHEVAALPDAQALLDYNRFEEAGCIVLDQHLPDLPGLDALAILRGRGIKTPVIMVTANGSRLIARAERLDVIAVLRKPLAADALAHWLDLIFTPKNL